MARPPPLPSPARWTCKAWNPGGAISFLMTAGADSFIQVSVIAIMSI